MTLHSSAHKEHSVPQNEPSSSKPTSNTTHHEDSTSSISRSALRSFSGTALSRFTGMLRDMACAYAFGTHEAIAAMILAYRLSHLLRRILGEGALQSAFIPLFEKIRQEDTRKAFHFFRDLSAFICLLLVGIISVGFIGLELLVKNFQLSYGNQQIANLMIIFLPSLLFICLYGINSSLLQCQKRYFTAASAPVLLNICWMSSALILSSMDANSAVYYLACGIVIGCIGQWLVTFVPTFKDLRFYLQDELLSNIKPFSPDVLKIGVPLTLGLFGVGITQINNAVDSVFARFADPEGPAKLWYAIRIQQLPLGLFGIAIAGALLPPLSRAIQTKKLEDYFSFLDFALKRTSALLIPATAALYVLGLGTINFIYGRGNFQSYAIFETTACLHAYAIALLPLGYIIVLAPALYAVGNYRIPALGALYSLIVNTLLNAFLVFVLGWGAVSIALSTSIASWFNCQFLSHYLKKYHARSVFSPDSMRQFFKLLTVALFAAVITWAYEAYFYLPPSLFHLFTNDPALIPRHFIEQTTFVLSSTAVFGLSLVAFAWLMRIDEILSFFKIKKQSAPIA